MITFLPMKPINKEILIKVTKNNGGLWKFKFKLISSLPRIDDLIHIRAPINETRSI